MAEEGPHKKDALTTQEARIAAMRVQGMSYRAIADELGKAWSTVRAHAEKDHVRARIDRGRDDIVESTVHQLAALRGQALTLLGEVMAEGVHVNSRGDVTHDRRVEAAREVMKATSVTMSEVKVSGLEGLLARAISEMSDEELGVNDADNAGVE